MASFTTPVRPTSGAVITATGVDGIGQNTQWAKDRLGAFGITDVNRPFLVLTSADIGGVGDDATDNTAAWNAAMNLLEVAGGKLWVPTGIYRINGTTQTVPGGASVEGPGISYAAPTDETGGSIPARAAVLRSTASMTRLVSLGRNSGGSVAADTGASISNIILDGQNLATDVLQTNGRRNYIQSCQVYWGASRGINCMGQNTYIVGGIIAQDNVGDGIVIQSGCNDTKILDLQVRQVGSTGTCVRVLASDVLISRNHFYTGHNSVWTAESMVTVGGSAKIVNITDNIIENTSGPEILVNGSNQSISINNNQFFNAAGVGNGTNPVIRFTGSSTAISDVSITNNTATGAVGAIYKSFVEFSGTLTGTARFVITGNHGYNVATAYTGTYVQNPDWGPNTFYTGSATLKTVDSGQANFTGDGTTTTFTIPTNLFTTPQYAHAQSSSAAAGAAGIAYTSVSGTNLIVTMKTAPANAAVVSFYWTATMSGASTTVGGGGALTNTTAPAVTGSTAVGSVLTTTNGSWSATPDSYTYQWQRAGSPISGATSSTYTTVTADGGTTVTCVVTAIKATYTNGTATSNGIAVVGTVTNFLSASFNTGTTGDLSSYTSDTGGAWVKNTLVATGAGAFNVSATNNDLLNGSTNSSAYAASGATPPGADYTVEADFIVKSLPASTSMGIAARMASGTANAYVLRYATSSGTWSLQKFVASGTSTQVGTGYVSTLTVGQTIHVALVVAGTTLTAYLDGVAQITATDASLTAAGFPGVYYTGAVAGSDTAGIHIDNMIAHA